MTQDVGIGMLPKSGARFSRSGMLKALLGLLLLAGASFGAWRYLAQSVMPATPAQSRGGPRALVVAAPIARGEFPVILSGLGTVTPSATSVVKTQISGQLVEINFTEGQAVKAGDVLARVDPRPYQLTLAQNEGQLQRDLALLQNAERDLDRYKALRSKMKDVISGQQIDTQAALVQQYKGVVAVDRAQVESARLNLNYCKIVSLIDGRVGLRQVDQGNYVQPSDANGVAIITRTKPITIIFTLPENRVQPVLVRLRSGAKLAAVAYDHSRSEKIAEGEVFAIDNQIDPATGTVKLRASFANDDEHLYPSQFVNVELHVDTLHDVVLAPQAAVQHGAQGPFVYAIKPDNSVAVRPVKLGAGSDERVVVTQGLDGGERVVVEGSDKLREGSGIVTASTEGPGGARAGSDEKSGAREQRHEDGGRDGSGKHARPIAAQAQ